jgi:hypothetical protein
VTPVAGIAFFVNNTNDPKFIFLEPIDHQIGKGFHQVAAVLNEAAYLW